MSSSRYPRPVTGVHLNTSGTTPMFASAKASKAGTSRRRPTPVT
jgi:hypothetical protein